MIGFFSQHEVHLWSVHLSNEIDKKDYWKSLLSENELKKANTFKFVKDQSLFISGRGILRCLLSSYLEESPQHIEIVYGSWGKPYLAGDKTISFNLSHSKDYALYAFSLQPEIGVDLEYIQLDFDLDEIMYNIFSFEEQAYFKLIPPKQRIQAFFRMWVCQEAFLKAKGEGWLRNIDSLFTYKNELRKEQLSYFLREENSYFYFSSKIIPQYASALFIKKPAQIHHYIWQ